MSILGTGVERLEAPPLPAVGGEHTDDPATPAVQSAAVDDLTPLRVTDVDRSRSVERVRPPIRAGEA